MQLYGMTCRARRAQAEGRGGSGTGRSRLPFRTPPPVLVTELTSRGTFYGEGDTRTGRGTNRPPPPLPGRCRDGRRRVAAGTGTGLSRVSPGSASPPPRDPPPRSPPPH